jgi:hypothetical protein
MERTSFATIIHTECGIVNARVRLLRIHFAFLLRWTVILCLSGTWRSTGLAEKPMNEQRRYLAYLLRLWQESGGKWAHGDAHRDAPLWRASLERPQGGERLGFASLEDLYAYLDAQTGSSSSGSQRLDASGCQSGAKPG